MNTGGAWLSSARVLRCWVKSRNERNPCSELLNFKETQKTAGVKSEEGEDEVKSSCPLYPGRHTCYNGRYREMQLREDKLSSKSRPQFGL